MLTQHDMISLFYRIFLVHINKQTQENFDTLNVKDEEATS